MAGTSPRVDKIEALAALAVDGTTIEKTYISAPFTTVVNRAQMLDLANDCSVRMGVNRIITQRVQEMIGESGPNGERVWGAVNDAAGQVRFVGDFTNSNSATGPRVLSGASTTDYVEVTFYGTGLTLLHSPSGAGYDIRASVDGGSESANLSAGTYSGVLAGRNYSTNQTLLIASGLSAGLHTVKIRSAASGSLAVHGFEILNESSQLNIRPGTAFGNKSKATLTSAVSTAYDSGFESGTLGSRGGRALIYLKSDGSLGKAVTPTNGAAAYLNSADHTNEEATVYHWREFGAGRADDFSLAISGVSRAFVLDDGTTELVTNLSASETISGVGEVLYTTSTNSIWIHFVGTGIDLQLVSSGARNTTIEIDGAAVTGSPLVFAGATALYTQKIASGLPYGTHVLKLTGNGASSAAIHRILVYKPKKPSLPAGSVELASYGLMATFAANATAGLERISTGVLRKSSCREMIYVGTWTLSLAPSTATSVFQGTTSTNADYVEYTFFGTGFDFRFQTNTDGATVQVSLNGSNATTTNFPTMSSSYYGSTGSFNSGTGILTQTGTVANGSGLVISGLPLGKYTVRLAKTGGTNFRVDTLDIITPIHSEKLVGPVVVQGALRVGSQGVGDSRVLSNAPASALAVGVNSGPTTASASQNPVPNLAVPFFIKNAGKLEVNFTVDHSFSATGQNGIFTVFVDGVQMNKNMRTQAATAPGDIQVTGTVMVPVAAGFHQIHAGWAVTGGITLTAVGDLREMTVKEVA